MEFVLGLERGDKGFQEDDDGFQQLYMKKIGEWQAYFHTGQTGG